MELELNWVFFPNLSFSYFLGFRFFSFVSSSSCLFFLFQASFWCVALQALTKKIIQGTLFHQLCLVPHRPGPLVVCVGHHLDALVVSVGHHFWSSCCSCWLSPLVLLLFMSFITLVLLLFVSFVTLVLLLFMFAIVLVLLMFMSPLPWSCCCLCSTSPLVLLVFMLVIVLVLSLFVFALVLLLFLFSIVLVLVLFPLCDCPSLVLFLIMMLFVNALKPTK